MWVCAPELKPICIVALPKSSVVDLDREREVGIPVALLVLVLHGFGD
jgi:hypothetical protein